MTTAHRCCTHAAVLNVVTRHAEIFSLNFVIIPKPPSNTTLHCFLCACNAHRVLFTNRCSRQHRCRRWHQNNLQEPPTIGHAGRFQSHRIVSTRKATRDRMGHRSQLHQSRDGPSHSSNEPTCTRTSPMYGPGCYPTIHALTRLF